MNNLPPGCRVSDIPGCRPEDERAEALALMPYWKMHGILLAEGFYAESSWAEWQPARVGSAVHSRAKFGWRHPVSVLAYIDAAHDLETERLYEEEMMAAEEELPELGSAEETERLAEALDGFQVGDVTIHVDGDGTITSEETD